MNHLKKLVLFRRLILVIQSKKWTTTQKLVKLKKITDHGHSNMCITTQEFNKLTAKKFAVRLKYANLATKAGIADFIEKIDFDDKLKNLNKKITANKTKQVEAEKEIN